MKKQFKILIIMMFFNGSLLFSQDKIEIIAPDSTDKPEAGKIFDIKWKHTATNDEASVKNVSIELSTNNGANWQTALSEKVESNTNKENTNSWKVDKTIEGSKECKIKISDGSTETISEQFEIIKKDNEKSEVAPSKVILADDKDTVGLFILRSLEVQLYDFNYKPIANKKIKIEEVEVFFDEGRVSKINVITDSIKRYCFTQKELRLLLREFSELASSKKEENYHKYFCRNIYDETYIRINDFLGYIGESLSESIVPDVVRLRLNKDNETVNLSRSSKVKLEYKIYTDALSLFGEQANGLVQGEGSVKILTKIWDVSDHFNILQFVTPYFIASRFDDQYKSTTVGTDSLINISDYFQRSPFGAGLNINLLKINTNLGHEIQLNLKAAYNLGRILNGSDSSITNGTITSLYLQLPILFNISSISTFKLSFGYIFQYYGEVNFVKNLDKTQIALLESEINFALSEDDKSNNVYVKFNIYKNMTIGDRSFPQLQIGYKKSISDIVNTFK